jgi:predicted aldo/keto reductase-like oxidoreductase
MFYRRFGRTNLQLSAFSLGTMRCLQSQQNMTETVATAIDLGVNHLETARAYGRSELLLGEALRELNIQRDRLVITTKLPPTADPNLWLRWLDESLERLQIETIDCAAIHGINTPDLWQAAIDCRSAYATAIKMGKIRYLGFSTHGDTALIKSAIETDLFDFVNLHYYYFFQSHEEIVNLAAEKDLGVYIISPADKGGKLYDPPAKLQELCQPLTPLEFNYRFLLADERLTSLSFGAANASEVLPVLKFADRSEPKTIEEIDIDRRLQSELNSTLKTDLCQQCRACLPCPEEINIPEILRLRNLTIAFDMEEFGKYRYRMFGNAGHWFPGTKADRCTDCGDCLPRCPHELDIPRLVKDTHDRLHSRNGRRLWEN